MRIDPTLMNLMMIEDHDLEALRRREVMMSLGLPAQCYDGESIAPNLELGLPPRGWWEKRLVRLLPAGVVGAGPAEDRS